MEKEICAYVAGIMDGEGSFSITWNKHQATTAWMVAIANTNLPMLEFVQKHFGGKISIESRCNAGARTTCYQWVANSAIVVGFIKSIMPYLVAKRDRAEVMLEYLEIRCGYPRQRKMTKEITEKRWELREKMLLLNQARIRNTNVVEAIRPPDWKFKPYVKLVDRQQNELLEKASALGV